MIIELIYDHILITLYVSFPLLQSILIFQKFVIYAGMSCFWDMIYLQSMTSYRGVNSFQDKAVNNF